MSLLSLARKHIDPEFRKFATHTAKTLLSVRYRHRRNELKRLRNLNRNKPGVSKLFGTKISYVDGVSAAYTYDFIFDDDVYNFEAADPKSCTILDCGANIGLSVIYFKERYPDSKVIAFEADPNIFKVLQRNVKNFSFKNVELHDEAVWINGEGISFESDGADAGHIDTKSSHAVKVKSIRLRDLLDQDIDLLKLDIEGAETEVLRDCADNLARVERIFLEYHSYAGQPQTLDEVLKILSDAGFRYTMRTEGYQPPGAFLYPWEDSGLDMRINVFASRA